MNIIWDENKNTKLKRERNISFDEISAMILENKYIDIVKHTKRPEQKIFILPINGYIHAIPFLIDEDRNMVLKTAFPSRKFHKIYWIKNDENKTG